MVDPDQVQQYLNSICERNQAWWKPDAFIDEINDSTWFEFGLKVKNKVPPGKKDEAAREENLPKPVLTTLDECVNKPILVIGSPGAGKSTFLAKALLTAAEHARKDPDAPIPVLVKLNLYESGIWELIQTSLENHDFDISVEEIKQLVAEKKLLLLADGVNELPEERARAKLKEFCRRKIPMIFTTRDLGGDLGIEHKLKLQPLSFPEVEQFLRDRLPHHDQKRVQELCDRVKDFGQTPLMVWMLYSIFQGTGEVPTTRGEAYRAFTTLYTERAKEGISLDDSRSLLAKLAFEIMHSDKPAEPILETEAQKLVGGEKNLNHLLKFHLLERQGHLGDRRIRFCHQSLQEYYAAEALLQKLHDISDYTLKRDYLNYLKWTEAIALMIGLPEITHKQAVQAIEQALNVDLVLGAKLAGSVKTQFQQATVGLVELFAPSEWCKVELLGITRSEVAIPLLCQILNDGSLDVCQRACKWLGLLESKIAVPALKEKLIQLNELLQETKTFSFPNPLLLCWEEVIKALARLSKQEAVADLREKLLKAPNPSKLFTIFCDGTTLLAQLDGKDYLPQLFEMIEDENSPNRQAVAVSILGKINDPAALSKLIQRLNLEKNSSIRKSIIGALNRSNEDAAALALVKTMRDPDPTICEEAAKSLVKQKNPVVVAELQALLGFPDWDISWNAAKVLGQLHSTCSLPRLISILSDKNQNIHIRSIAAEVLGELGNEVAIPGLLEVLVDSDYSLRRSAAISLGRLNNEDAVPELLKAFRHYYPLNHQNLGVQTSLLIGDQVFNVQGVTDEDLQLLGNSDAIRRWFYEHSSLGRIQMEIALVLDSLGTEEALNGLFNGLNYAVYYSAQSSAIVLGKRGQKEAVSELIDLLKDMPSDIPTNTLIEVLASLTDETVVCEMIKILKNIDEYSNSDFYLRNRAAIVLQKAQFDLTYKYLSELKELTSSAVVEQAFWAILGIQDRCGFYNYEIAQSAADEGSKLSIDDCGKEVKGIQNIYNIEYLENLNAESVGNLNTGKVEIKGDQVGVKYESPKQDGESFNQS